MIEKAKNLQGSTSEFLLLVKSPGKVLTRLQAKVSSESWSHWLSHFHPMLLRVL